MSAIKKIIKKKFKKTTLLLKSSFRYSQVQTLGVTGQERPTHVREKARSMTVL